MRQFDIEAWVLRILERVGNNQPTEDSRVELKAVWPDVKKTARQIAGHANAARGEPILWLIGVDQTAGIKGANHQELANWFPQIKAEFESEVPSLQDINVHHNSLIVCALCFDTSRFPYLVKNPAGGAIAYEVPWREGTRTRTAARNDLLLMLGSVFKAPKVRILSGQISLYPTIVPVPPFRFHLEAYVVPREGVRVCLAVHLCSAKITFNTKVIAESFVIYLESVSGEPRPNGLLITSPEKIVLKGEGPSLRFAGEEVLELQVECVDAFSDFPVLFSGTFARIHNTPPNSPPTWEITA